MASTDCSSASSAFRRRSPVSSIACRYRPGPVGKFDEKSRVKLFVEAEVGNPERVQQFVKEERPIRFFVSYAHADKDLKGKLLAKLQTHLRGHASVEFE